MLSNTISKIGWKASDFALPAVDGRTYSLADVLVVFICNHCPYVKASIGRIVAEAEALCQIGVGTIAIMPNDTDTYAEDSFDNMKVFAARHRFTFPYAIDKTQEVARAYDAQCTPDFFGFNAEDKLQYRGRLDASRMTPVLLPPEVTARVSVEQASVISRDRNVAMNGAKIGMHTFGSSAPLKDLLTKFGFTLDNVVAAAKDQIAKSQRLNS